LQARKKSPGSLTAMMAREGHYGSSFPALSNRVSVPNLCGGNNTGHTIGMTCPTSDPVKQHGEEVIQNDRDDHVLHSVLRPAARELHTGVDTTVHWTSDSNRIGKEVNQMPKYRVARVWRCTDTVFVDAADENDALCEANEEGIHPIDRDELYEYAEAISEEWEVEEDD